MSSPTHPKNSAPTTVNKKNNRPKNSGNNVNNVNNDNNSNGGNNSNNSNNSNKSRNSRGDNPTVRLSKALSWLLRHNAVSQGIAIRSDGYVKIADVLGHPKFKDFTLDDIVKVVDTNEKKRFEILEGANGEKEYIRAVQGHSIAA
ncbi:tRNA 2'-phosphotransferase 1, partial [Linnemannia zychae]